MREVQSVETERSAVRDQREAMSLQRTKISTGGKEMNRRKTNKLRQCSGSVKKKKTGEMNIGRLYIEKAKIRTERDTVRDRSPHLPS